MLSLKPNPHATPSKWQYRLSRFMLTRVYWVLTRLILPLMIFVFVIYQVFTSQTVRTTIENTRNSVYQTVANLPLFVVEKVVFENATKLREEEIRALLNIEAGTSILDIDRDAIVERLSSFDAVGSAQILYNYNGVMEIVLEPRVPAMIFLNNGIFSTIDGSGHRVETLNARSDRAALFVVSGTGADEAAGEALTLIKNMSSFAERVSGLARVGERRWDIVLSNGSRVMLSAEQPLSSLKTLLNQQRQNDILNRNFDVYDLRNPLRPVLRLSPAVDEEMKAIKLDNTGPSA